MSDRPDRVDTMRIDRLVLRGVDLDVHDAAALPALIAAELQRRPSTEAVHPPPATTGHDVARHVAHRIAAEVRSRGGK